jgi:hypothetical protein
VIDLRPGPVDTEFHRNNNNDDSESNSKNDDDHRQDGQTSGTFQDENARGPLRCINVVSYATKSKSTAESQSTTIVTTTITVSRSLIALQPSLAALYIQQWFLGLQRRILGIVGPKRVQLWRGIRFVRSSLVAEANQNVGEQR